MTISLNPELEAFINGLVASGRFRSADEACAEGLRRLEEAEHERLLKKAILEGLTPEEEALVPAERLQEVREAFRRSVQESIDALDRGEGIDGEEFMAQLRVRYGLDELDEDDRD